MKLKEQVADAELKLMLKSELALINNDKLNEDLKQLFSFGEEPGSVSIWYLETPAQELRQQNWSVRYRQFSDGQGYELTLKKRFSEKEYKAMLASEEAKMFAAEFTCEIDIGYSNRTYSLSFERIFTDLEEDLTEPEAKRLAVLNSPPVFTDWTGKNIGFVRLCASTLLGPVVAATYKGTFQGYEAKLEIWKLGNTLTELSFDVPTKKSTPLKRELLRVLTEYDLLITENQLKTDAFLDYFIAQNQNTKAKPDAKPEAKPDSGKANSNPSQA